MSLEDELRQREAERDFEARKLEATRNAYLEKMRRVRSDFESLVAEVVEALRPFPAPLAVVTTSGGSYGGRGLSSTGEKAWRVWNEVVLTDSGELSHFKWPMNVSAFSAWKQTRLAARGTTLIIADHRGFDAVARIGHDGIVRFVSNSHGDNDDWESARTRLLDCVIAAKQGRTRM